jgi:hypothetical protein
VSVGDSDEEPVIKHPRLSEENTLEESVLADVIPVIQVINFFPLTISPLENNCPLDLEVSPAGKISKFRNYIFTLRLSSLFGSQLL